MAIIFCQLVGTHKQRPAARRDRLVAAPIAEDVAQAGSGVDCQVWRTGVNIDTVAVDLVVGCWQCRPNPAASPFEKRTECSGASG
jgi:hypothetical protein